MKSYLLLLLISLMMACNPSSTLSGTYLSQANGKFGQSIDTLQISHLEGHHYKVERITSIRERENGKLKTPHYRFSEEEWLFDESTATLINPQTGRQLSFYPDQHLLMIGKRVFKKMR